MPKAVLDSLDGLGDDLKKEYEQHSDGRYHLKLEDADQHRAVSGLVANRDDWKGQANAAKEALAKFGKRTPEDITKLEADLAEARKGKGDWEAQEGQLRKHYEENELAPRDKKLAKFERSLHSVAEAQLIRALDAAGFHGDLMMPHAMPYVRVVEGEEAFEVEVLLEPGGKTVAMDPANPGQRQTVDQLAARLVKMDRFKALKRPSGGKGSGGGDEPEPDGGTPPDPKKMTAGEKAAYIDKHGLDAWNKLIGVTGGAQA